MGWEREKRPVDARTGAADGVPDVKVDAMRFAVNDTTAASTALEPGFYGLTSTNTKSTPKTWEVEQPEAGDLLGVFVASLASTSSPIHIKLGSAPLVDSSKTRVVFSTAPAGALMVALSSTKWGLLSAGGGVTFTTST